jgi:G3E family GTPase
MSRSLPVTLIAGFLGAGKTSFLHNIISEHGGGHLAVMVENPGPLNADAKAIRGLCGAMRRNHDIVLEIPNGDDATQLEWLAARFKELSQSGRYERVLIEVAGTTNVARLAEHFLPNRAGTFSAWAELHQIVCVVDALDYFRSAEKPELDHPFWGFQNEQIAGATLVVLNKCDLLEEPQRQLCRSTLDRMHRGVRIIETAYGEVPPEVWSQPAGGDELKAALERHPIYPPEKMSLDEFATPALATALYRVHRPFHPARFWDWFNGEQPGLLRVKGLLWLATRNLFVGGVSRTRWQNGCGPAGIWWAALPREEWPQEPEALTRMQEVWQEPYGDRRQELILIGEVGPLGAAMRQELDACLLTDYEYALTLEEWGKFPDPFPAWDLEGE